MTPQLRLLPVVVHDAITVVLSSRSTYGPLRRPTPSCSCAAVPLPLSSAAPQASRWAAPRFLVARKSREDEMNPGEVAVVVGASATAGGQGREEGGAVSSSRTGSPPSSPNQGRRNPSRRAGMLSLSPASVHTARSAGLSSSMTRFLTLLIVSYGFGWPDESIPVAAPPQLRQCGSIAL